MLPSSRIPEGCKYWARLAQDPLAVKISGRMHVILPDNTSACEAYKLVSNGPCEGVTTCRSRAISMVTGNKVNGILIRRRTQHLSDDFCEVCAGLLENE